MSGFFAGLVGWVTRLVTGSVAGAIDLDGTNDYFSRTSDFTGNADGKTFTFSAWVWNDRYNTTQYILRSGGDGLVIYQNAGINSPFKIVAYDTLGNIVLNAESSTSITFTKDTFVHILISIDIANTSNRSVYINDVLQTVTWTTYTNEVIDFTQTAWTVGANAAGANKWLGRISNLFLDYTYRDLSVEANRRIFTSLS